MSDVSIATEESLPPIETPEVSGDQPLSPREAARALSQYRWKRDAEQEREQAPPKAAAPTPEPEIPAQPEAAAPETDTGVETQQAEPQAEEAAPLELPRSWSKDKADIWAKLDPDAQSYLLEQDSKASRAVRQAQNEAAEIRKGLETERIALEQSKKQYEEALPSLLQALQQAQLGEFADIKTTADAERLAREDWPRYALWSEKQRQLQMLQQQAQQVQQQQQVQYREQWTKFATDEDAKFIEAAPEMADEGRARKVADASLNLLKDIGFSDQDLSRLWNGEASLSLRDHRAQLLIRDAVRYREAQQAARTKAVKPVPVVQRPGSPAARVPEQDIRIQQLDQQFDRKPDWKNAAELLIAQRAARR